MHISEILEQRGKHKTPRSERAFILEQIYSVYMRDEGKRYAENKKRFYRYLQKNYNHLLWYKTTNRDAMEKARQEFIKKKLPADQKYIKTYSVKDIAILTSHLDLDGLYYILSIAKDKEARNENASAYIIGCVLDKKK